MCCAFVSVRTVLYPKTRHGRSFRAPAARECHPREEHLIPLMVAAGAAGTDRGRTDFHGIAMGVALSSVVFG